MKYIIVNNKTASHNIIREYARNISHLSHQESCFNAFKSIKNLNYSRVTLIFPDINMSKLSGFYFLKTAHNPPRIIVTNAYKEFALEGDELNIDNDLFKPFSFQRFIIAVKKVKDLIKQSKNTDDSSIFLKDS
jgi:two-component SAPR family response regulator